MRCWGLQMHVFTCCIWEYPRMHRHLHAQSTMINVRDTRQHGSGRDNRLTQVEAKKAVPKEEHPGPRGGGGSGGGPPGRTKKVFVGGLAPSIDEAALRQYFEQFGGVEDAVVMYDHDNRRVSLEFNSKHQYRLRAVCYACSHAQFRAHIQIRQGAAHTSTFKVILHDPPLW